MSQMDRRLFLAAGAAAVVPFAACARDASGDWLPQASLPWPVQEIYCAVLNGTILTAGGLVSRQGEPLHIEDRVGIYHPGADRWSEGPRLPAPRHHPMVFAEGGRAFVFGGYGRSEAGDWTSMTEGWTLVDDDWVPTTPLPGPQSEAVGVTLDGRLHLLTGRAPSGAANGQWTDHGDVDIHRVYLPAEARWEAARPCPMARNSAAAAVLDGAIWVAGGRTVSGGGAGRLDRYDPVADRWDTLAPIPRSQAADNQVGGGLAMAAIDGRLVVFGGEWFQRGGGGVFQETWVYSASDDAWAAGPDMSTPRHGLAAASIDGTVYAIAGGAVVSGGRAVGTVEAWTPSLFY
ncbi:MAG: kelch repeat-containing protein [Rhodoferax sp.]|uniref:Kelch repeat-containing protein n=1 Tax=Rhodoferax sp. TaxID=50421 RepID=UPI002730BE0E|nr:kelch repeat-containing protein [Rhodoferax sp.]MDP1528503.1 kelch repeat-containing protein [Rhodoferax sp.]